MTECGHEHKARALGPSSTHISNLPAVYKPHPIYSLSPYQGGDSQRGESPGLGVRQPMVSAHLCLFSSCVTLNKWFSFSFLVRRGVRLGLQMVKTPPAVREIRVPFLDQEDPLLKGMATHFTILAWRIPRTEEPGGLQSMGSQRVGHNWANNTRMRIREVNPYMCLSLGSPEFNADVKIQVKIPYSEVTLR